jgi:protein-disulfide isomerase
MRSMTAARAILLGQALAFGTLGCGDAAATIQAADEPQAKVVARVHGHDITLEDVDEKIFGTLADLRQQEYDARRGALDALVAERLIEAEATRRGLTTDSLLRQEVEDKVEAPDPAEVEAFYEMNKARLGNQPREQAIIRVEQALVRRILDARNEAFVGELRKAAGVAISLEPPRTLLELPASAPALGPADAPVTLVEYTDYQCPYCRRAQITVEQVLERYGDKVRLVYRDLPLDFHAQAFQASRAARCAGEQQRFWEYHRGLLMEAGDYSDADLGRRASALGLDANAFGTCLASERHSEDIRASLAEASRLGVQATPTFFINGRRLSGAQPLEAFVAIIDEELASAS